MNAPIDALARRLLEPDAPPPAGADAVALAWALKALCYEAWATEPARAARAAQVLAALMALEAAGGHADPQVQALAAWTGGIAHIVQGRLADAVAAFDAAAAAFAGAGLPGPQAECQVPKIMALAMLGRHDDAATCGQATQRALVAQGNWRAAGRVSQNLAALHLHRHDYAAAAAHSRDAVVTLARAGDAAQSVSADIGLAGALAALGDLDESQRIGARARMRAQTRGLALQVALADELAAVVALARGRWRDALAGLETARRQYEQLGMPQYLAQAEMGLADAYLELRLLPEALALFDAAVAQFRALAMPVEEAWARVQQGRAQALQGAFDGAQSSLAAAGVAFAAAGHAVGSASAALAEAELALARGQADAARDAAARARDGLAAAGQAAGAARADVIHAEALLAAGQTAAAATAFAARLEKARTDGLLQVQLRCLSGLGRAERLQGRPEVARTWFDHAIELFEDQQRALPGDEIRAAFLADHLRPFEQRLALALADEPPHAVLAHLERYRARALDERLAAVPDPEGRRERLAWLYRQMQRTHGPAAPALGDEMRRAEAELLERVRRDRLAGPAPAGGPDGFSVAALQTALAADDRLVEYGFSDGELFALIVSPERVRLQRRLATAAEVEAAVGAFRFQVDALRHGAAPLLRQLPRLTERARHHLRALHALLWAPLAPALAGARRVLVVAPGVLAALPFAALEDAAGEPLAETWLLATAPSARVALRGLRAQPAAADAVLALGESSRLPQAGREAEHVASLFVRGRAFTGPQATLQALQQHAAEAGVVHLACHAAFRADNPRFSALHLADGPLTVDAAEALPLAGSTVVLSACETGLADGGLESVGLVRAFLVAGAARVLASLWPVDDAVAAATMTAFYGALRAGAAPAAALQQAQRALRQAHPHPHAWAAFALHGGF